jgi:hypothetical protein
MASRDRPPDPREALAAAEAVHLAARYPVRGPRADGAAPKAPRQGADRRGGSTAGAGGRRIRHRAPVVLAAVVAAGTAAVVSFAPVAVVVALLRVAEGSQAALATPTRVAAAVWLLAHGVPLQTGPGQIGLLPLALTALAAWRLSRAGVHVTRAVGARGTGSLRAALIAAGATAAAYGLIGLLVAAAAAGSGWWAEPLRAGATLACFGFAAAAYGAVRTTGAPPGLRARFPAVLRDGCRAGGVAGLLVLAAGAVSAGIAVAVGGAAATDTLAAYGTGVAGQAGLTLVCLAYAPNLAAWAASYLIGPGFLLGAGTVVRSSEVAVGPLPALPVFAGLPDGPLPSIGAALLAIPTVAGLAAGALLVHRMRQLDARPAWGRLLGASLLAGPVGGLVVGAACAASAGSLGTGHLASLGPVAWQVAVLAMALVTPGSLLGAALAGLLLMRRGWMAGG